MVLWGALKQSKQLIDSERAQEPSKVRHESGAIKESHTVGHIRIQLHKLTSLRWNEKKNIQEEGESINLLQNKNTEHLLIKQTRAKCFCCAMPSAK